MNSRFKIKLRDPAPANTWIDSRWLIGSDLYFDTDSGTGINLSKEIQTLTDIHKITVETALGTSLPATVKNLAILGISMDVEGIDNDYPEHQIEVEVGFNTLTQNLLKVVNYDRASHRIEIELTDNEDNWIVKLKDLFLDQLNFGSFEYTRANLLANWQTDGFYNDGDPGYWFGHGFYGRYIEQGVLTEGDFRPLIHAKKIIDLTSKAIGWKIVCPVLETDAGRTLGHYLLKNDFLKDQASLDLRKFKATITAKETHLYNTNGSVRKLVFPVELEDPGNNYDASTGIFTGSGVIDFIAELDVDILFSIKSSGGKGSFIFFELVNQHADGTIEILDEGIRFDNSNGASRFTQRVTLSEYGVLVKPGDKVYVHYSHTGPSITRAFVKAGGVFYSEPQNMIIQPGHVLEIGKQLRHDLVLDYLKGLCHIFKFMIYTDRFANTLYFLTPFDLNFFGDTIAGYFSGTQKDWRPKVIQNTEKYFQKIKAEKNRLYSFKKSTDTRIQDLKLPDYAPLYSKFIDNGFDRLSEMETFENPYFEPTFNDGVQNTPGGLVISQGGIMHAPYMVDNNDGQSSFNIAPRIFFFGGYTPLYYRRVYDDGTYSAQEVTYFLWDKNTLNVKCPNIWQVPLQATSVTGVYPNQVFVIPDKKIAYGDFSNDLYQMIYKRYDRDLRDLPTMTEKVNITEDDFISEDFRDRALIDSPNIHTGDLLGRVVKLSSFDTETGNGEITFIADNQISNDCIGYEIPNLCQNYPTLKITKVGTVYTLTREGTVGSAIASTVFKWKYLQAFTWNTSNSVNTPIDNVQVLMIVTFSDGCPPITITGYIAVNKYPDLVFTKIGNIFEAEDVAAYGLTVNTTTIIYSYDNINWILYQGPIDLKDATAENILFKVKTTFTEAGSTPGEKDFTYSISMHESECPDPDQQAYPPTVAFSKVKNGTLYGYSLYKVGEYSGLDAIDYLRFREKGKNQAWVDYDNRILSQKLNGVMVIWEIQRVIVWCTDKGCPPYCSPIIEIDGSDYTDTLLPVVESGTTGVTNTHTQKWEHPDTPGLNEWKVVPLNNEIYHVPLVRTFIEQVGAATSNINVRNYIWDRWNFKTEYIYTWNIDYKLNKLQLHLANSGGIGAQLTVILNITYQTGDTNDFLTVSIENAINEYLNTQGYIKDQNYQLIITLTGTTTKSLKISFVAKHNPTDTWIGIYAGTDVMETESPAVVIVNIAGTKAEFQITTTSAPIVENISPYGTSFRVRLNVSAVNYFLNDSASNFNLLVALSPCPIVPTTLSDVITDTGKKFSLSASLTGCGGTSTFIWMYAGLEKGGSGKVISYTSSAIVYTNVIQDIKILGSCSSATHGTYEKLIRLTP